MKPSKIRVIALFVAKSNQEAEVLQLLTGLVEPTRKEKGCVFYELQQNIQNPKDIAFVEEWDSEHDLNVHLESKHIHEIIPQVLPLLETPPDVRRYLLKA